MVVCVKSKILSTRKQCKTILTRFISLMEMETLQNWSDSEAAVATCSLRRNKPVPDYHLLVISAFEYLFHFCSSHCQCHETLCSNTETTLSVSQLPVFLFESVFVVCVCVCIVLHLCTGLNAWLYVWMPCVYL